jgi:hypothetical protein
MDPVVAIERARAALYEPGGALAGLGRDERRSRARVQIAQQMQQDLMSQRPSTKGFGGGGRHVRAALSADLDWRRGGGRGAAPAAASGGNAGVVAAGGSGRSPVVAKAGLALGSQSAVVKLASFGGAGRVGVMFDYLSREGGLSVETERGETVVGAEALGALAKDWEPLFDGRAATRDAASFSVEVGSPDGQVPDVDAVRRALQTTFGDRRFVLELQDGPQGATAVGVVLLRAKDGERLTGDRKAAGIVQERARPAFADRGLEVGRFRFTGHAHGVEGASAKVARLVEASIGGVVDQDGRRVIGVEAAKSLVQKQWRGEIHARSPRDVAHVVVSAKAGTDPTAFKAAVGEFLSAQFPDHRYAFAIHDPKTDPKPGAKPHVHAHVVLTMKGMDGSRLHPNIQTFRQWRETIAEKARGQGIAMEATTRADRLSAPSYSKAQVEAAARGRASEAARTRVENKRRDRPTAPSSPKGRAMVAAARADWRSAAAAAAAITVTSPARASAICAEADRFETRLRVVENERSGATKPADFEKMITAFTKELGMGQLTKAEAVARVDRIVQDISRYADGLTNEEARSHARRGAELAEKGLRAQIHHRFEASRDAGSTSASSGSSGASPRREVEQAPGRRPEAPEAAETNPPTADPRQPQAQRARKPAERGDQPVKPAVSGEKSWREEGRERREREKDRDRGPER